MGSRSGIDVIRERLKAKNVCDYYGIEFIDPAANENVPTDGTLIDMSMDYVSMKNFVAKDFHAVTHCDVLLVLTGDTPSDGTSWEMGWAFARGIPIVMVAPKRCRGEIMSFSNILVNALFPTVEEACKFIAENYARV